MIGKHKRYFASENIIIFSHFSSSNKQPARFDKRLGYIYVANGCWKQNVLMTSLRWWWQLSPISLWMVTNITVTIFNWYWPRSSAFGIFLLIILSSISFSIVGFGGAVPINVYSQSSSSSKAALIVNQNGLRNMWTRLYMKTYRFFFFNGHLCFRDFYVMEFLLTQINIDCLSLKTTVWFIRHAICSRFYVWNDSLGILNERNESKNLTSEKPNIHGLDVRNFWQATRGRCCIYA